MLKFDEEAHVYTVADRRVPSVTQVLSPLVDWSAVDPAVLAAKATLGRYVHRLVELECLGELDVSTLTGPLVGYYEQWMDFRRVTGFRPVHSELKLYSARFGYAGTMDLHGWLDDETLIDTKAGATPVTAGLQTAAYLQLGVENGIMPPTTRRRVLDLKEKAWKLSPEYKGTTDLRTFLAQLTVFNWQQNNGRTTA